MSRASMLMLVLGLVACSSEPSNAGPDAAGGSGPDAAPPGLDAAAPGLDAATAGPDAATAGPDASPFAFDYEVREYTGTGTVRPLAAAIVAADLPGGGRVEATADQYGKVHFDGVDFSKGRLTLTAWKAGYSAATFFHGTKDWLQKWGGIPLVKWVPVAEVKVTGAIKNLTDATHFVQLTGTASAQFLQLYGPTAYTLGARWQEDFSIVATELNFTGTGRTVLMPNYGWARVEHAGIDAPLVLDVDFQANKVIPVKKHLTYKLPVRVDSPLRTDSYGFFDVSAGGAMVGTVTQVVVNAAGDGLEVDGEHLELAGTTLTTTHQLLANGASGAIERRSQIVRSGAPVEGEVIDGFLDAFDVTQPANQDTPAPLANAISWTTQDTDSSGGLFLVDAAGVTRWSVYVANHDERTLTVPALPSTANPATVLGTEPLTAAVYLRADFDEGEQVYRKIVNAPFFQIQP